VGRDEKGWCWVRCRKVGKGWNGGQRGTVEASKVWDEYQEGEVRGIETERKERGN
jgi:hypothetical protein